MFALLAAMSAKHRVAAFTAAAGLLSPGCTLAKPIVGVVTGPVVILGSGLDVGYRGDGRDLACALAVLAVIGAGGGLVTGIVSDFRVLTGDAAEPCHNWWNPFAVNR